MRYDYVYNMWKKQVDDPILANVRFENWEQVFTYLTEKIFKRNPY